MGFSLKPQAATHSFIYDIGSTVSIDMECADLSALCFGRTAKR